MKEVHMKYERRIEKINENEDAYKWMIRHDFFKKFSYHLSHTCHHFVKVIIFF